jgi:hypothetical protein
MLTLNQQARADSGETPPLPWLTVSTAGFQTCSEQTWKSAVLCLARGGEKNIKYFSCQTARDRLAYKLYVNFD